MMHVRTERHYRDVLFEPANFARISSPCHQIGVPISIRMVLVEAIELKFNNGNLYRSIMSLCYTYRRFGYIGIISTNIVMNRYSNIN